MPVGAAGPFSPAGPAAPFSPAGALAPATAIVVVSHSRRLADGVAEIASQMAPGVVVRGVGGLDDDLGTDARAVRGAVADLLDAGHQVLLTADLGSALMVAEIVVEEEARPAEGRCALAVDCPVVRGTLAAAVAARAGGDAGSCARAAVRTATDWAAARDAADWPAPAGRGRGANGGRGASGALGAGGAADARGAGERAPSACRSVRLTDPAGLHARPAAALAALLDDERARMRVGGSPATTLQEILALGLHGRTRLEVTVTGPHAERTLDRVERLLGGVV